MTTKIFTRKEIVDQYVALCLGLDRMLGTDTYSLLYDGKYSELIEELDRAKHRLEFNKQSITNMQLFIGRLK